MTRACGPIVAPNELQQHVAVDILSFNGDGMPSVAARLG